MKDFLWVFVLFVYFTDILEKGNFTYSIDGVKHIITFDAEEKKDINGTH